jgi:lysophospholipase L1-like esterase
MWRKQTLAAAVIALVVGAAIDRYTPAVREWLSGVGAKPWQTLEYQYRIALFDAFQPRRSVVIVGDSQVQFAEWGDMFPGAVVANRGINNDTTEGVVRRLPQIEALKPSVVVLMIGINDFRALHADPAEVAERYRRIIDTVGAYARVVAVSVLLTAEGDAATVNPKVAALNVLIKGMCRSRCTFLDVSATLSADSRLRPDVSVDGLHLNARGYRLLADHLAPLLAAPPVQQ